MCLQNFIVIGHYLEVAQAWVVLFYT